MDDLKEVEPLSYKKRRRTFFFLLSIFFISLPFLYLYATGYRFDLENPNSFVRTGGIYVAAERTGAEIYIDDELVRETRVFRTAFYAQNLEPKTHKVHVQKDGHHTWVKELPVTPHRVTEAQSFNMPIIPRIRVISEYTSATGSAVTRTLLPYASTTNEVIATSTPATSTFTQNPEYQALIVHWKSTSTSPTPNIIERVRDELSRKTGTTTLTDGTATVTKESGGVRLSVTHDNRVQAQWIGTFEQMPYYYCAAPFARYSTTSSSTAYGNVPHIDRDSDIPTQPANVQNATLEFIHPAQEVSSDIQCDRTIILDAENTITAFNFFPNSTDFAVIGLDSGIYVIEIDARSWQNKQPLLLGKNLRMHVENGNIYVYDGTLIYHVILER